MFARRLKRFLHQNTDNNRFELMRHLSNHMAAAFLLNKSILFLGVWKLIIPANPTFMVGSVSVTDSIECLLKLPDAKLRPVEEFEKSGIKLLNTGRMSLRFSRSFGMQPNIFRHIKNRQRYRRRTVWILLLLGWTLGNKCDHGWIRRLWRQKTWANPWMPISIWKALELHASKLLI